MQILKTKLYIPQPRPDLVPRPHLVKALERGLHRKLTLISAPAGFGKTTLLSEWIHQSRVPFAWLSLEVADNDLGRFLAYFIAALHAIQIDVDEEITRLLGSPEARQPESVLIPLINQIAETRTRFGMVLDDYHLIQSGEIHAAMSYLLDHFPPNMHLVIATRADPPLPLARLRARGELTEVREAQLRFSMEETTDLIQRIQNLKLSEDSIRMLLDRTGGWAAALQMVGLALKGEVEPDLYIWEVSGGQDYIADFLSTEVIDQQPERIHAFLLQTSILDRLTGPLCDALTGGEAGADTLRKLRDENLFLFSLDDESRWYRYHRLFADLLQQRLMDAWPERVSDLYLKASAWCEAQGQPGEAIEYALRGDHTGRAATLIEAAAEATLIRSEIATFLRWIEELPDESVRTRPGLAIYAAWAALIGGGDRELATLYLAGAATSDPHTQSRLDTVQAMLAQLQGEREKAIALGQQAYENLPPEDHFFRSIAAWNLSAMLFISGDVAGGQKMLEALSQASRASRNPLVAIIAECRLAAIKLQSGNLKSARDQFEVALDLARMDRRRPLPVASEAMMGLGKIHWEWGEDAAARQWLEEAFEWSKRWRPVTALEGAVILAHIHQAGGDAVQAEAWETRAEALARRHTATEMDDRFVAAQRAHLAIMRQDWESAERWGSRNGFDQYLGKATLDPGLGLGASIILCYELIIFARLLIARGRCRDALGILGLSLPVLEAGGHRVKTIEIHLLTGIVFQALGQMDAAVAAVTTAIELAEPGGYLQVFRMEGPPAARLLAAYHARGRGSSYSEELLRRLAPEKPTKERSAWIDPLSEREVEVLRWLDTGQTVPEIADELFITVSTLRTHVRNIYSKLGVHSRFEAVSRGKELGLI